MSLKTLLLNVGATTVSVTGGVSTAIKLIKSDFNTVIAKLEGGTNLLDETILRFSSRSAVVNKNGPNGYSQARSDISLIEPMVLSNEALTHNSVKMQTSFDIEATRAQKINLIYLAAQVAVAEVTEDFFCDQATAV